MTLQNGALSNQCLRSHVSGLDCQDTRGQQPSQEGSKGKRRAPYVDRFQIPHRRSSNIGGGSWIEHSAIDVLLKSHWNRGQQTCMLPTPAKHRLAQGPDRGDSGTKIARLLLSLPMQMAL